MRASPGDRLRALLGIIWCTLLLPLLLKVRLRMKQIPDIMRFIPSFPILESRFTFTIYEVSLYQHDEEKKAEPEPIEPGGIIFCIGRQRGIKG